MEFDSINIIDIEIKTVPSVGGRKNYFINSYACRVKSDIVAFIDI